MNLIGFSEGLLVFRMPKQVEVSRTSDYKLNNTIFRVSYGDITSVKADALVNSEDNNLSMSCGLSRAFYARAGATLRKEAIKHIPLKVGDVAVTSAGDLSALYVFHAVTIDCFSQECIQSATLKCLQRADALEVKSIAFPPLGTVSDADVMARTIAEYLMSDTKIEAVILVLFSREHWFFRSNNLSFERAAALASVYTQFKRLIDLFGELEVIVSGLNEPNFSIRVWELKLELRMAQKVLLKQLGSTEQSKEIQSLSEIKNISEEVINFISIIRELNKLSNEQQEAKVMRTKLDGLYTLSNIYTYHLNAFEIEKDRYVNQNIPEKLEIDIEIAQNKIKNLGNEINQTKRDLAMHQAML